MKIRRNALFCLSAFLLSLLLVINPLAVGRLTVEKVNAQSLPRPYAVFVNGQGNCCSWGMNDLQAKLNELNAEFRFVPYSNFDDGGQSRDNWTSTDERFLQDGADLINNQLDRNRPLILIGHSYGGDSVLKLLPRINRRIQFVAVIDPVSTGGFREPLTRDLGVGSNVDYFFNRWQENEPFPNDYWNDGSISCSAGTCDQAEQQFYTRADGSTVTERCDWWETCSTKNDRTGHQGLPTDDWVERTIGDRISEVVASSSLSNPTPTTVAGNYRISDGTIFFSNASDAYCTYSSSEHIVLTGNGEIRSADSLPSFRNDGPCPVMLPAGAYRLVDGRIIASNGSAFCRYVSHEHYRRRDGRAIRQLNGEVPLHAMANHFDCAQ
jgi:pimeloyl-ACP methyl ester carboxylesterase